MRQRHMRQVVMLVVVAAALATAPASASASFYCNFDPGSYGTCIGPYQALSKNAAIAQQVSWTTCAGAQTSAGVFYGQYFCASNYSCHTYGGGGLRGLAHNHEAFGQVIGGSTNGDVQNLPCPRGGPVGLVAMVQTSPATVESRSPSSISQPPQTARLASFDSQGQQCLSVTDGTDGVGITCATSGTVRAHGLVGVMRAGADGSGMEVPGTSTLYALAPSNAKRATLRRSNGTTRAVDVTNGFLAAEIADDETMLQWDTAPKEMRVP